ncbi:Putative OxpP cycle protein OpcA [Mycobacteroides abscessus]|nr:Putative OxpP cycle protein OpcA [Mycobacteroides abscessus]
MSETIIEKYADTDALVTAAGDRLASAITGALAERGKAMIVLTGGGTGIALLKHLRDVASDLDWTNVHVFWGDDRYVPKTDPERNAWQAWEAWSRITYWRALLASALDQAPYEGINSAVVSGLATEPALDVTAGWLASRIDGPVTRVVGDLKVELHRDSEIITLSRPQTGAIATLARTGRPSASLPLPRRETRDCLAEDLRRLDPDEIYRTALEGIAKVQYV